MAKNTNGFFDDDEEIEEEEEKKPPASKTPPNNEEEKNPDSIDWKAKYEEAQAEKLDSGYLDELRRLDDDIEGNTLDEIPYGARYKELRGKGLSARAAYAAIREEIAETTPEEDGGKASKNHMSATSLRSAAPKTKLTRAEREMMREILPDLSDDELEDLNRRVSGK